eukprot:gene10310-7326_t
MNETYLKRSGHIMKGIEGVISAIDVEKLNENIICSIYEMASLSILDHHETPVTVFSQLKALATQLQDSASVDGNFRERLSFLVQAQDLLSVSHEDAHFVDKLARFCSEVHKMIYIDSSYYNHSFYSKFAAAIFRRSIYEPLQKLLSQLDSVGHKVLTNLGSGLTYAVKTLEAVFAQDSIFFGTVVTLNVNVLVTVGDFRGAISVAKRGLYILEEHRAARVDFNAMLPEDVRDIMALQRQSFTTRAESVDWYHSVKRLGAHAFAGFGIFGLGSSADRSDQALAEIHTELQALYFRTELRYGINHYLLRKSLLLKNKEIELAKAAALKENPNLKSKGKDKDKTAKAATTKATATAATATPGTANGMVANLNASMDLSNASTAVSIEKLPVFNTLKIYCAKNTYAQSLLYLEAAKAEPDHFQRHVYLQQAFSAIHEAEQQETKLVEHFGSYTLMTHQERHHPIVLSRSHRYIYVAPVGCRKLKHVAYYKVHAKEKGSGTEVSIYNTDLPGADKRIEVSALTNFKHSVIRIGPLRNGELYMFGSVAYNAADTIVGGVSPSTMPVEAVNPLPTVLLWSLLGQTAQQLQENRISMEASWRVCCRYFQSLPLRDAFSLTSGRNIFIYDEPVLCSLAVQQSTPVMLHHFLASLIRYETLHYHEELFGSQATWNCRKKEQLQYMTSFERLAAVASLAAALQNQDVTVQLLLLAELLLDELLRYDMAHLAKKLQPGLIHLLLCLQKIPKRHWHDTEHRLYYKLTTALIQVAMLSRNLTPLIDLFNDFFPEVRVAAAKDSHRLVYPTTAVLKELEGLIRYADVVLGDSTKTALLQDAKLLLASDHFKESLATVVDGNATNNNNPETTIADFWRVPAAQRYLKLTKKAKEYVQAPAAPSPEQQEIEKAMFVEQPIRYSDYLAVLLQWMAELLTTDEYTGVEKLLQRFPICREYVAPTIQQEMDTWQLPSVLLPLEKVVEMKMAAAQPAPAAAAGGKKAPPPKKGAAPEPEPTPPVDFMKIPDRFLTPNDTEINTQRAQIAQLMLFWTSLHERTRGSVNHFVRSHRGMLKQVVPNQEHIRNESTLPLVLSPSAHGSSSLTPEELVRRLGCAVTLLTQAGYTEAASAALLRWWNYLVAEYVDPHQFVRTFTSLESHMNTLLKTVTSLIERIGWMPSLPLGAASSSNGTTTPIPGTAPTTTLAATSSLGSLLSSSLQDIDPLKLLEPSPEPSAYQTKDMLTLFNALLAPVLYLIKVFMARDVTVSLKTFHQTVWPLVMEAQQTLINQATETVNAAKKTLEKYIFEYEEAQRKKRKKKLRIARTEKDEEELLFEAEKAKLEDIVQQAEGKLAEREAEMAEVQTKQSVFDETLTKGAHMAHQAQEKLFQFVSYVGRRYGSGVDWRALLTVSVSNEEVFAQFAELRRVYEKTARYLREKKERLLLVDVLDEYTNVLIRFGLFADVAQFLNDIVDGLFNAMDACLHWKTVMHAAFQPEFDRTLIPGLPLTMMALGKLSRYCAVNDYDRKAGYARMSSEIARLLFQESIGHPVTIVGLAAYECVDLGGYHAMAPRIYHGLYQSLEEHVQTLFAEAAYVEIFPLVVLGEYIASVYLRNLRFWLQMRIHRIRALIKQRLFSEAMSMYAGIRSTITKLAKHEYGDPYRQMKAVDTQDPTAAYDSSANDLPFHGQPCVFYNNRLPGDEAFNAKALEWLATTAPLELEKFLSGFTVMVPEADLSPAQRQRMEEERKAKAEAEAAAAASNKKGAKPPAKGAAPATTTDDAPPAYDGPRIPVFSGTQLVQVHLLSAQFLTEISTLDGHQVPKHAAVAEKWATKAMLVLQQVKDQLFTRFTDAARTPDVQEFFQQLLHNPDPDRDHGNASGSSSSESKASAPSSPRTGAGGAGADGNEAANFMIRAMRQDTDWLQCFREALVSEQALLLYRRKYREILAAVTRWKKLLAHPLFQRLSSGDQQFQLTQTWFQCQWYHLQALEGQGHRAAIIACITEAALPCCQAMQASHWARLYLHQRAVAYRNTHEIMAAAHDMDQVLASFTEQHDLETVGTVHALVTRASLLQQEIQQLTGHATRTCLESYHKHQKTLELLRRAADIAQRLGFRTGMFAPDTNVTYQLASLDYQYPNSETSKQESFSGAVSGYHLLHPALNAFTDIHDNAPPLTITAEEAHRRGHGHGPGGYGSPWQRLRLGPIDGHAPSVSGGGSPTSPRTTAAEETAFLGVHSQNVYCNVYLREARALLQAQVALLHLLDDIRCKDLHRLRHVMRSRHPASQQTSKAAATTVDEDEDDAGPFDPKMLQLEEIYLVEYVLKLLRHVAYVSPVTRARVYYFTARARMTSPGPQGYADLRAYWPTTATAAAGAATGNAVPASTAAVAVTGAGSTAVAAATIPPIMLQIHLTPIVTAMHVLTQAKTTHAWSLFKRLCLEIVRYFGQAAVVLAVEEQGIGQANDVLRQAAQYLLLAAQVTNQRAKLRQGVSELVESGAELNVVLSNELLAQWTTQCFTSSMAVPVPSPAEVAAAAAAAATAAAAAAPAAKGGKAPAPAKGAAAAAPTTSVSGGAGPTTTTGRDAVALLVTTLREQAEFDDIRVDATDVERWWDDAPSMWLSTDLHVLLQQTFPSSYGAACAVTNTHLPTGPLLPLVAAQSALQGPSSVVSSTVAVTQAIAAGAVTAVWDSLVATPADWVKMHSDIVTGKWFTLDGEYGLYSHAAIYFLLGDHVAAPAVPTAAVAAAPPAKGKAAPAAAAAAAAAAAPALATDSKDPVLTRLVLYKGDVDRCERRLRQLAYDLQNPRDASAVTGDATARSQGQTFTPLPSPSYFASLVWSLYVLLKQGFVGDERWAEISAWYDHVPSMHALTPVVHMAEWDESTLSFTPAPAEAAVAPTTTSAAPASPRQQTLQQMQTPQKPPPPLTGSIVIKRLYSDLAGVTMEHPTVLSLPYTVTTVKHLADLCNRTRDQAAVSQPEICNFLRLALGHAPPVSARGGR